MAHRPEFFAQTPVTLDAGADPFALRRDALSDVLELIRVRGNTVFACSAATPFGVYFGAGKHRLHVVQSGSIVLQVEGIKEAVHAHRGDLVLLVHGHAHAVTDQAGGPTRPLEELATCSFGQGRLQVGNPPEGTATTWLCGEFGFDGMLSRRLLAVLPPVITLRGLRDRPFEWLELSCRFILDEALNPQAGSAAMVSRLLDVLFVQLLRTWASGGEVGRGWLSGAIDPRMGKALAAMHADPGHDWSVGELAALVSLSRSAFAERFQKIVGQAPLGYLTAWRLDRAAELLRYGRLSVADICERVGYSSEAAFSRAFKLRYGASPMQWRKTATL
jgi:AraC-like DNA-binding protein